MQGVLLMENLHTPPFFLIGQMSKETGVNIETIRYYERVGIMPSPDRSAGGNRQYNQDQLKRLNFIRRARGLGFSLQEIRGLFEMVDREDFTCGEVRDLTADHLAAVRDKILHLRKLEKALGAMIAECNVGDVPACPIIDALYGVN
jgi:MerR family mercuric resistance operon transcriptional regulator